MMACEKLNFFVFIGTSGTGKTSLLDFLRRKGFQTHEEVTRHILSTQLNTDGPALPSKNPLLFIQTMLNHSIRSFETSKNIEEPVFFDRGIPDLVAYASRFKVPISEFEQAAQQYRYNPTVFVFPPWKEIFVNDEFRKGSFEIYEEFHELLIKTYSDLNYDLIEVPLETIELRAEFVLKTIREMDIDVSDLPTQ